MSGTLLSPGVSVEVTGEVYYGSAVPGTIPLVVFATQANKTSPTASTSLSPYTTPAYAGQLQYVTSQRAAIQNNGYPLFTMYDGSVVQGDELNEVGLHAIYSYLGIASSAYLLRADIDLGQLVPSGTPPTAAPINGTYWLDLTNTAWGLFVSNGGSSPGSAWTPVSVLVPQYTQIASVSHTIGGANGVTFVQPMASFGNVGNYAIVPWDINNFIYQKFLITQTASTSAATSSGTVLTFTSVPSGIVVGATVADLTNPSAIPTGTTVTAMTSTTVTLSHTATSVSSGNVISFGNIPAWIRVGSSYLTGMTSNEAAFTWKAQFPNVVTTVNAASTGYTGYSFSINGVTINLTLELIANVVTQINTSLTSAGMSYITATEVNSQIVITNAYGTGLTFADVVIPGGQTVGACELLGITAFFAGYQTVAVNTTAVSGVNNPVAASVQGKSIMINGYEVTFSTVTGYSLSNVVTDINTGLSSTPLASTITASINNFGGLTITNTSTSYPGLVISDVGAGTSTTILGLKAGILSDSKVIRNSNATYPANSKSGDLWVKGTSANNGANWAVKYYNSTNAAFSLLTAPFYPFNSLLQDGNPNKDAAAITAFGSTLSNGTVYIGYDNFGDTLSSQDSISAGGVQQLRIYTGTSFAQANESLPPYTSYQALEYEADFVAPTTTPTAGTLWYDNQLKVDLMVSNGMQWLGYRTYYPFTDQNGPILSGSQPTLQTGGHMVNGTLSYALVNNDIWIDTSDTENYPLIYSWSTTSQSWNLIDNTDHTSPFGIVFGDARANSGVAYTGQPLVSGVSAYAYNSTASVDMTLSSYVDPDAGNSEISPDLFPDGMILFNTRFSTGNVKQYLPTFFNTGTAQNISEGNNYSITDYTVNSYTVGTNQNVSFPPTTAARWVTASGNTVTGTPNMLRKAQRAMIVESLESAISTNQQILAETTFFNLIAVPGYPELMPDMKSVNLEQNQVSLSVGDTPLRLAPDSNSILTWATNASVAAPGEDGLGGFADDYTALYYPWGLGQNYNGDQVVIPPSSIALRVIAYNDQVSYPWFAPAGFTRGLVTNATSVGYLTSSGTFQTVTLNQGQRDTLYQNNINPIAYIPNRGLVVFGQKTLSDDGTIINRVNIARLVNYISYTLSIITAPYLFEQNDKITQTSAANSVSTFLNSLVGLRALYDYAVVCDSTNNTPETIDLNQLWIDVMIQPLNAVEFIYIPVRVVAEGTSNSLNVSSSS